ncbi:hypothetical protein A2334_02390 [Candidatus Roizmanbacteria bacterium RIFOXYB2_FULL_38_10]|uniref:Phage holin family protein n=1 Tax=Candidatus Roizmanbacteria bacterium RIFOXYD1_FULL_38_12 TaxID=1802093 RepID=A0A1F7L049_9BACT|nr:MAG: hypothetical protein A3K47_01580 [Candidatus Roizmanbacteria bacterium RIFOXYA2_FULL_38_14]OGK63475.1 MAG: hypothetical protein A3K27_01580 [Candidatus Roizmanbacteria bacterium RIFOXYA1_FULL_37_12]OGK65321.1 MAG: hypothetical protein A3K38_01580 [Candidatus Roizmanbacteria bacterium RIFOXYB1_FULL_40_23]OGK67965.1 MAG: hypothetical protein A2334_02390 [Candidatus Roizmanbacteria bacterium RIFOXYB2_FULL_38_10]OGK69726.1 MAG: hypothetical protein A3K21_01585 [Candidatus Roizmanbacteria ba
MNEFMYLLTNGLAVYISSYLLRGVHVKDFFVAIVVAVILSIVNIILKPMIVFLTLPLNILTLGLFTLVINGFMVILVSRVVPGFTVDSVGWGILFSIILSFISSLFNWLKKE